MVKIKSEIVKRASFHFSNLKTQVCTYTAMFQSSLLDILNDLLKFILVILERFLFEIIGILLTYIKYENDIFYLLAGIKFSTYSQWKYANK